MFEEYQICPYTGLRSFTEEESLYFKGREENIESASEQLQRNKFLMLTGASGDGKSSLVYAGIIPNARSGFLKSKYTQWCVADFRPERSPFKNLCKSVADQLDIASVSTVESELQHGFSALVDLYRNSKRYTDPDSVQWQDADDAGRAAIKREAANLLILVDQFEEFFTNPENYHRGAPSRDSNLVLNLLLETARIALEENLPIYIVFTMRSDFIGQCAAFRGLPEYIGFSQFFVPRLNRSQLQQVIEEPATLSGNRITRRLTERLIHDLTEGVDQLPILQHALNQIWVAANNGNEEMDLIHYAMVGGMPVNELPDEHIDRFKKWFESLPSEIQACYHEPNLQNVLDTHTNKLYEQAARYYETKTGNVIADEDAKTIIKVAFTCLTKIDQSRAVRNRMTLSEITNILGDKKYTAKEVGVVLNIFREPGNTFIRPFISDEPESHSMSDEVVLDITHESLIRNWEYLEAWAKEEFDNYAVSQDFEQQLNRWVESNKSNGFLLSIGQLTYFETWYNKVKPNVYWIARYLPEDIAHHKKLERANEVLGNAQEFLRESARKHAVTRAIMRYGVRKIAAVFGLLIILTLSSFAVRDYIMRQNEYVLKSIHQQALVFAANPKVSYVDRINLLVEELRMGRTTINEISNSIQDPFERQHVTAGIATALVLFGGDEPKEEIFQSLQVTDSLLSLFDYKKLSTEQLAKVLRRINEFRVTLEFAYQHNPDPKIDFWRQQNAKRSAEWVSFILEKQPVDFHDMQNVNLAIEHAINYSATEKQRVEWLAVLSPFENGNQSDWVKTNYQKDKFLARGPQDYGFRHNGLYQLIAYLYASQGNSAKALQCMDTLLRYSQQNFQQDYAAGADNAAHIAATFFLYGKTGEELDSFVKGYCQRKRISEEEFYDRMIGRTLQYYYGAPANLHLYSFMDANSNLVLQFTSKDRLSSYFNKYRSVIDATISDPDVRHFQLALSYKNEGILKSLSKEKAGYGEESAYGYFEKAVSNFNKVDSKFRNERISVLGVSGADQLVMPRQFLFVYPDIRYRFHPQEPRSFMFFYYTDVWMNFILEQNLFDTFYPSEAELGYLTIWFKDYNQKIWVPCYFVAEPIQTEVFAKLEEKLADRQDTESVDLNWLHLYAGYDAQQGGDTTAMFRYYSRLKPDIFLNLLRSKEFTNQANGQSLRMIAYAVKAFTQHGHFDEAYSLIEDFKKPINRSSIYAFSSITLRLERGNEEAAKRLQDSSLIEMKRVGAITTGQPHRQLLAYSMTLHDPEKNTPEASQLIKNLSAKSIAQQRMALAYGFHGRLYAGQISFPPLLSDTDQAIFYRFLLTGYAKGRRMNPSPWRKYDSGLPLDQTEWINYIDENI
ncbi:MAG: ATP-binding protein [Cyclobacteriaceae bacterium]|nr:ATP-binding protein [Cyclobacteriaceae bacterium]